MADYSVMSEETSRELETKRMLRGVHTVMPCVVKRFDAGTHPKVSVQPVDPVKITLGDKVSYKDAPVLNNIPVVLPYAQVAGYLLTLPIKPGDTGVLLIADKSMDAFLNTGRQTLPIVDGEQTVSRPRGKSLSDGIFVPGLIAFTQSIQSYNTDAIELRDTDRKNYISLKKDDFEIKIGEVTFSIKGGAVSLITPGNITINAQGTIGATAAGVLSLVGTNMNFGESGNTISGNITQSGGTFTDGNGINSTSHHHGGVQTGSGNTGGAAK